MGIQLFQVGKYFTTTSLHTSLLLWSLLTLQAYFTAHIHNRKFYLFSMKKPNLMGIGSSHWSNVEKNETVPCRHQNSHPVLHLNL
jgi:hypothetical protein